MIDEQARARIKELEAQIGQLRGEAGGLQGVLRQLTDGRITTLHQHPFSPDAGPSEWCGDWELIPPDDAVGLPDAPPSPGAATADGNTGYFVDGTSGEFFRVESARGTAIYTNLGVVDAGGLTYVTLDSWDPSNVAMVCGDLGVWKTTNLSDPIPTFAKVLDDVPGGDDTRFHRFKQIASSIVQKDLWMVVSKYWNPDQSDWFCFVHWSDTGGATWNRYGIDTWGSVCGVRPTIETSARNAQEAWIVWNRAGNEVVTKTSDCWTSHANTIIAGLHSSTYPSGYHRFLDNPTDQLALFAGKSGTGSLEGAVTWSEDDGATGTTTKLSAGTGGDTRWCGGYTWGTNKYWCLNKTADYEFHVSDDALTWAIQYTFPGTTQYISGWPTDGEYFYAAQNGAVAPLLTSDDRGATWTARTGNWADLGVTGDITCFVPVWAD